MPTAEATWSVSGRAKARAKGRRDGSFTCLVLSRDSVIYIGQSDACTTKLANLYCTLSYLLWFWLLLIAAVCARSFDLRLLLLHLILCVCQCCQLAFMLVVHTAVLTQYVRVSSYLDGTTTSSKQNGGDMKWRGQWPHRSEHSGIVRCESTALVHAYSRGCLECQRSC